MNLLAKFLLAQTKVPQDTTIQLSFVIRRLNITRYCTQNFTDTNSARVRLPKYTESDEVPMTSTGIRYIHLYIPIFEMIFESILRITKDGHCFLTYGIGTF